MTQTHVRSIALALGLGLASTGANALLFNFSGSDNGGTGSATMDIGISGSTLTAILDNTSPTSLDDDSGGNAPGIAGFGFNLDPDSLGLISWELVAKTTAGDDVTIGSSSVSGLDWIMGTTQAGVTLDYLPQVESGTDGLLFNPAVIGDPDAAALLPGGSNSVYFTTATLTMMFTADPTLLQQDGDCSSAPCSPYVRMQNVGAGAGGSLKLPGVPDDNGGGPPAGEPLPEPGTLLLLGSGLLGLWRLRRR